MDQMRSVQYAQVDFGDFLYVVSTSVLLIGSLWRNHDFLGACFHRQICCFLIVCTYFVFTS